MQASRFFGILLRIGQGIGAALGVRRTAEPAPQVSAFAPTSIAAATNTTDVTEPAALEAPMPAPVLAVSPRPAPAAQSNAAPPLPAQPEAATPPANKMRSIEEIRADLARLRQNAKERHAELLAQREVGLAATDLMDIAPPPPEPRESASDIAFAATAFVDFGDVKSRRER
ncbi:hypothetical protein SRS16CHR_03510 [Variovorax sp. SRS16]|uniref:hypothetical protein n=1 Tax=Variovorax sp. SRS16 TaxID=282217 RepID=UPI001316A433|nr:hypothetical protein [Variovorax sp. SRS16]VTU24720.1 hypothetical protein SRS16CHR_03510 [Variovorax sp. SRS16]